MRLNDNTIKAMALLADADVQATELTGGWHIRLPNGITLSVQPTGLAKATGDGSDAETAWWKDDEPIVEIRPWQTPEQVAKQVRTLAAKEAA